MKKTLLLLILLIGCKAQKEVSINYSDTIKVSVPVIVPEKTSDEKLPDSLLIELPAGDSITRETDTTILVVYRDTGSYRIKTVFKKSYLTADTIIKIDTVLKVKYKKCPEKKEKSLLDRIMKNFVLTLIVIGLLIILLINFIRK